MESYLTKPSIPFHPSSLSFSSSCPASLWDSDDVKLRFLMVIELSGVQFGLKYKHKRDLKS